MSRSPARWIAGATASVALGGCLFDPDFFDRGPLDAVIPGLESGLPPTGVQDAAVDLEPDVGMLDAPRADEGPACDGARCGLVEVLGPDVQLVALVGNAQGRAWALVNGTLETVADDGGRRAAAGSSKSHLLLLGGDGFAVERDLPLPFQGTSLALSGGAVFVAGHAVTAGTFFNRDLSPLAGREMVARVEGESVAFTISWGTAATSYVPLVGADNTGSVTVAASPGNADVFLNEDAMPYRSGTGPNAPGAFLMRLDASGAVLWDRLIGDPQSGVQRLAVSTGGASAFTVFANGSLDLWGEASHGQGASFAGVDVDGHVSWSRQWAEVDLSVVGFDVDAHGNTWAAAHVQGSTAQTGDWPAKATGETQGTYGAIARIGPTGAFAWSTTARVTLTNPPTGFVLEALGAREGARALVMGQTVGPAGGNSPLYIGDGALTRSGTFLAQLDENGALAWARKFADPSGNASSGRRVVDAGGYVFIGADVPGKLSWGSMRLAGGGGFRVVLMRIQGD